VALIDKIAMRGAHGLFLKAPDELEIAAAVDRAVARGVPVVTLVTDVANCRRAAYVGMGNRAHFDNAKVGVSRSERTAESDLPLLLAAGETAAYLIGEWLGEAKARVLTTLSSNSFRGASSRRYASSRVRSSRRD
jgi:LacI family transcriptional regulator